MRCQARRLIIYRSRVRRSRGDAWLMSEATASRFCSEFLQLGQQLCILLQGHIEVFADLVQLLFQVCNA